MSKFMTEALAIVFFALVLGMGAIAAASHTESLNARDCASNGWRVACNATNVANHGR